MITDMYKYVDIGVNLTGRSFKKDISQVIERAHQAGVQQLIVTGTNVEHSEQALLLTEQYRTVCYATVGLHPHHASDFSSDVESELRVMLKHENAVAVGECGLDFNRNFSTRKQQIRAFEGQLAMAIELQKPLFLHQRDAHDDFIAIIKNCRQQLKQIVVHCFTEGVEEVNGYVSLDMHIGVTGWICDERRGLALRQAVKHIPLDRILLETDAPYLLPRDLKQAAVECKLETFKPVKKGRNEPCFLPHIARVAAEHMQLTENELVSAAYRNSCHFFPELMKEKA